MMNARSTAGKSLFGLPRTGIVIGVIFLLGIVAAGLFWPRLIAPLPPKWGAAWNLLHVPAFFVVTMGLAFLTSHRVAVILAVVLGLGSEGAHGLIGRSASLGDLCFDFLGIALAAVALHFGGRWRLKGWVMFGIAFFLILSVLLLVPVSMHMSAERSFRSRFPDIGQFGFPESQKIWKKQQQASLRFRDDRLLVRTAPQIFGSGLACWIDQPDWNAGNFKHLRLEFENPSNDPVPLGVRIDDSSGGRYRSSIELPPAVSEVSLSLSDIADAVDLSEINRIVLFVGEEPTSHRFFINTALLE